MPVQVSCETCVGSRKSVREIFGSKKKQEKACGRIVVSFKKKDTGKRRCLHFLNSAVAGFGSIRDFFFRFPKYFVSLAPFACVLNVAFQKRNLIFWHLGEEGGEGGERERDVCTEAAAVTGEKGKTTCVCIGKKTKEGEIFSDTLFLS